MMRPPLTRVELRMIHARNRGAADVEALLWEVARLRARLLRVDQLQGDLGELPPDQMRVLALLRAEIKTEPCIPESEGLRPAIIPHFLVGQNEN